MADAGRCKACNCALLWVTTSPGGRRSPIEAKPAPDGNVLLSADKRTGRVLSRLDAAARRADGVELYINHFARCPEARSFRRA